MLSIESFVTLVASGAVCILVLRNSEYLHGECWSLSNQGNKTCLGHQRNVINQCYVLSGESFVAT
jgi:hypothetical protein